MKKIFSLVVALLTLVSCSEDFLNLTPQYYPNDATFFKTQEQFTQAVNGAYSDLRGVSARQGYLMGEMRSDNTHYTRYKADRGLHILYLENIADFVVDDQNQWTNEMYYACYTGISRANTILNRIEGTTFPDDFKNKTIGEAKFIRAFMYFQLVQCYGDVPLHLEEVTGADNAFLPRSSVNDIYTAIVDDVKDAIEKLPTVKFPQNGAATKGAAKMLYAYVLMTKPDRDYATAETQLKDIMNMGYELLPNYADIYDTSKKNGKESIFEIQYQMGDQGQQSDWLYYFIPKTTNAEIITGVPDCSTLLTGGWNVPTPEMIASYEPGDLRVDPSIAVAVGTLDAANALVVADVLKVGDPKINDYPVNYPFINKYRHAHSKIENTDDNWPVYRYADCLLLLAECLVEQGRAGDAAPYVNQVRARAGLPAVTTINAEVVANERRHELAFENHRWYDLLRTGKAIEVMTAYGKYIKTIDTELPERTYQIKPEYLLYPIPYNELQLNDQLKQNPGY
ncbi:RagB/SusD family nutrient uptake outer membrane protein [Parabacteroides merdae]|uniref:RagB/SusD family nutrient uptake outer membrane protein n=1 Tax=Parabacteroides merdae TaxID=46503 RepID=UPI00139D1655|nr:RagB/SusD family nutrient uptake outer membrane protein [Parabacteroides merdae]MTU81810.1 RagB/SusD family nutrient uptake outer membrane protein [Parabacteroides merdae]